MTQHQDQIWGSVRAQGHFNMPAKGARHPTTDLVIDGQPTQAPTDTHNMLTAGGNGVLLIYDL